MGVRSIPANTCHIHMATHRYQLAGHDAEWYAEPTAAYFSFCGAIEFIAGKFGFYIPDDPYGYLLPMFRD